MKKTRNFKKLMSSVLALVMVLSTMMLVPLTIGAEGLQGNGTEATPYLVGSKADLEAVATAAAEATEAVYVKLTADIADLGAAALAQTVKWNIDGDNYTVTTTAPLIPVSDGGIVIKNLNVVTAQTAAEGNAAGLVGELKGTATIENCTVSGTLTATTGIAGGFVAVMYVGTDDPSTSGSVAQTQGKVTYLTFSKCTNNANITAATYAGGFVAHDYAGNVTVEGGINAGNVTTTSEPGVADGTSAAAGFVGWQHDKAVAMVTIKNAINLGTITPGNGVGAAFVGHAKSSYVTLENCYDNGLVAKNLFGTDNRETVVANNTATLAETMALITPPKTPVSKLNATAWDGITTTEPALQNPDAPNSAENPYLIGTAAELAYFSYHADRPIAVDYWAKLTADINLGGATWMGMLTAYQANLDDDSDLETVGLNITIDGDNYTIYNAKIDNGYVKGFFKGYPDETVATSYAVGNLTVSNLHFANIKADKTSSSTCGIVVGGVANGGVTTLTNVTVGATCVISVDSGSCASGGLAGCVEPNGRLVVDKCLSEIVIANVGNAGAFDPAADATGTLGGIVGKVPSTATVTITNSIAGPGIAQNITASNKIGAIAGGIIDGATVSFTNVFALSALANIGARNGVPTITNCYGPFEALQAGNAEAIKAICLAASGAEDHVYDDACDESCAHCGLTRVAPHAWENACDTECECGATRTIEHTYDNDQDTTCNVCGATRTVTPPAADNTTNNTTNNTDTTTKAPADTTTAAADDDDAKKKGCKKSIDSTYAVIALISVLGFAFVAKKREEN